MIIKDNFITFLIIIYNYNIILYFFITGREITSIEAKQLMLKK